MLMFLTICKSVYVFLIVSIGHGKRLKEMGYFHVLVDKNGSVVPLEDQYKEKNISRGIPRVKRNVIVFKEPNFVDNYFQDNYDEYIESNFKKESVGTTLTDANMSKNAFYKVPDALRNTGGNLNIQFENQQSLNNTLKLDKISLDKILEALRPALKNLESNGGEEMHKLSPKVDDENSNKCSTVLPLDAMKNYLISYNENTDNKNGRKIKEEIKEGSKMTVITNTNNITNIPNQYILLKKEFPNKAAFDTSKKGNKNYGIKWDQMTTEKKAKKLYKVHKHDGNASMLYQIISPKTISNHTTSGSCKFNEENRKENLSQEEINEALERFITNIVKTKNVGSNKVLIQKELKQQSKSTYDVPAYSEVPIPPSTAMADILIDFLNLNSSNIYTKSKQGYMPDTGIGANVKPTQPQTYVRPECKKEKGKITCKMGRYKYVINNGDQEISNDVLSKFVALIYRRSLEGDKCFDISVVNPSTAPCACYTVKPKIVSTEAPENNFAQVTIVCNPVKKEQIVQGAECGANTPTPQEVIYECKWKKIGI